MWKNLRHKEDSSLGPIPVGVPTVGTQFNRGTTDTRERGAHS